MAKDPMEALLNECPKVVDAIGNNDHIGTFLYAVLCEVVAHAAKNKLDVRGIVPEVRLSGDSQIKIRLDYKEVGDDYVENRILWRRNPVIADTMEVNKSVLGLAPELIEVLVGWANQKGIGLPELVVENVMVPRGGGCIVADMLTKREFDERYAKDEEDA